MPHSKEGKRFTVDVDGIKIGKAASKDIHGLLVLTRACIGHMRRQNIDQWDEVYPGLAIVEADVRSDAAFVACHHGTVAGAFVLNGYQDPEYSEVPWTFRGWPVAVVHRLMVCPEWEGKGLARLLMEYAEASAVQSGHRIMRLDAFSKNPRALRFYEKLGYRNAGQVRFRKGCFLCFEKILAGIG